MFDWFRKLVGLYDYTRVEELHLLEGELEVLKAVRDVFVQRAMGKNITSCGIRWRDYESDKEGITFYGISVSKRLADVHDGKFGMTIVFEKQKYEKPVVYLFKSEAVAPYNSSDSWGSPLKPVYDHEDFIVGYYGRREVSNEEELFNQKVYERFVKPSSDFTNAIWFYYCTLVDELEQWQREEKRKEEGKRLLKRLERKMEIVEEMKNVSR